MGLSALPDEVMNLTTHLQMQPQLAYVLANLGTPETNAYVRQNLRDLDESLRQLASSLLETIPKTFTDLIPSHWLTARYEEIELMVLASLFGRPLLCWKEDWSYEFTLPLFGLSQPGSTVVFYKSGKGTVVLEVAWPCSESLGQTSLSLANDFRSLQEWKLGLNEELQPYMQLLLDRCKRQKLVLEPALSQFSSVTQEIITFSLELPQCAHKFTILQHFCGKWLCAQCVFPYNSWTPGVQSCCPYCQQPLSLKEIETLVTKQGFAGILKAGWEFCCKCLTTGLGAKVVEIECGHTACLKCILQTCEYCEPVCTVCQSYASRKLLRNIRVPCDKCGKRKAGNEFPPISCGPMLACWSCIVSPIYCPIDGHEYLPHEQAKLEKVFFVCVLCQQGQNRCNIMRELACLCQICQACGLRAMAGRQNSAECPQCSGPVKHIYLQSLQLEIGRMPKPRPAVEPGNS